jgi:hypothetical protein
MHIDNYHAHLHYVELGVLKELLGWTVAEARRYHPLGEWPSDKDAGPVGQAVQEHGAAEMER